MKLQYPLRKHRGKLHDIGFGNDFLYITTNAQATKAKIDKWGLPQTKTPLHNK